jgi:hypothetical protein
MATFESSMAFRHRSNVSAKIRFDARDLIAQVIIDHIRSLACLNR